MLGVGVAGGMVLKAKAATSPDYWLRSWPTSPVMTSPNISQACPLKRISCICSIGK